MEPRIQYAQTADGVSIAFWTLGEGMPYVSMPVLPLTHVGLEWQWPELRRAYERLSEKRMVVRYDGRGSGLSERDVTDFSLDAHVLDLEAVVDHLGLESFALIAHGSPGPVAIAYAARHPERVSRLVFYGSFHRWPFDPGVVEPLSALVRAQWGMGSAALSAVFVPSGDPAKAAAFTELQRVAARGKTAARWLEAFVDVDTTSLLKDIQAPTLVVHRRRDRAVPFRAGREMAALIPGARLEQLEGDIHIPFWGDSKAILDAIDGFLREGKAKTEVEAPAAVPGAPLTILFTDMEGSTALTQRLGDAKAQEVVRTHNAIVRDALKAHSGSEIKHTGDGIMASFASASRALECAIEIQRAFAQHNESNPDIPIRVRIGLNAGEPVAEEEDLFGTAVQLAARICAQAEPGEILAPIVVRELAAGKGFLLADRGDVALRGFEDPVRLYEVRWRA